MISPIAGRKNSAGALAVMPATPWHTLHHAIPSQACIPKHAAQCQANRVCPCHLPRHMLYHAILPQTGAKSLHRTCHHFSSDKVPSSTCLSWSNYRY